MDIQFLLERLEALVVNGRKVPMTSQVELEQGSALDLIDQMRAAIPEEVRLARRVHQEGDRLIQRSKDEADQIVAAAQEQAALLLRDHDLMRRAETDSADIVSREFEQFRIDEQLDVLDDRPRLRIGLGIVDGDPNLHLPDVFPREALGNMERVGGRMVPGDRDREVRSEDQRRATHEAALRGERNT